MKEINELEKIKEKFDRGEISQDDMDIETQLAIADLYKKEIEGIREEISDYRNQIEICNKMITEVDYAQQILDDLEG